MRRPRRRSGLTQDRGRLPQVRLGLRVRHTGLDRTDRVAGRVAGHTGRAAGHIDPADVDRSPDRRILVVRAHRIAAAAEGMESARGSDRSLGCNHPGVARRSLAVGADTAIAQEDKGSANVNM